MRYSKRVKTGLLAYAKPGVDADFPGYFGYSEDGDIAGYSKENAYCVDGRWYHIWDDWMSFPHKDGGTVLIIETKFTSDDSISLDDWIDGEQGKDFIIMVDTFGGNYDTVEEMIEDYATTDYSDCFDQE